MCNHMVTMCNHTPPPPTLGVILDSSCKIRHLLTDKAALDIFKTMVLPYINFGNVFYTICPRNEITKLQTLQNSALRTCFNVKDPRGTHVKDLHDTRACILPAEERRKQSLITCVYRQVESGFLQVDQTPWRTRQHAGVVSQEFHLANSST